MTIGSDALNWLLVNRIRVLFVPWNKGRLMTCTTYKGKKYKTILRTWNGGAIAIKELIQRDHKEMV